MDTPVPRKPPTRKRPKTTPEERAAARRPRFLDRQVRYVKHARRALRRLARLGNTTYHDYSDDEAAKILYVLAEEYDAFKRAFRGAPKEKGLFDL